MAKKTDMTFEQQMTRLKEIVETLERQDIDLDKSLGLYQEGLDLSKALKKQLNDFESKINKISEDNHD